MSYSLEAVIFDLDGVVTQTALIHFQAWKETFDEYLRLREKRGNGPFREFTHQKDYLPYVDGKPRYQGVKSFLESRNIHIPFGKIEDLPNKETICGLGNKKNLKFQEIIKKKGAQVYPSTLEFIKVLKEAGIKVAVASSSKNCRLILKSCGLEDLFPVIVDGITSEKLSLKGKPEPDIFITAARRLSVMPENSIVVEDASSGVEAARYGGFGLVIGVARKDNIEELLLKGADVAVRDLSSINLGWIKRWFQKKPLSLFEYWQKSPQREDILKDLAWDSDKIVINPSFLKSGKAIFINSNKKLVFFLDYDGTLTSIVERPELAILEDKIRSTLKKLCEKFTVAIVSGRQREDVEKLVGIEGIFYAGSHGFDIKGLGTSYIEPQANQAKPVIAEIVKTLSTNLGGIEGILIEEKKFSVAVHYRLVDERFLEKIKNFVEGVVQNNPSLRLMQGKKVFEILPAIDWDKGKAVRWIMHALGVSWDDTIVYIGDDTTDEDAFRLVRTQGLGILVSKTLKQSSAQFWVTSPLEVKRLFERILTERGNK